VIPDAGAAKFRADQVAHAEAEAVVDQNIGHGGEPHAQLIGHHGGGRRPICKQFELLAAERRANVA
jgi:hypothetical protein